MALTQLSPSGLPGRRYNFVAKAATIKGAGTFTVLSVTATPGKRHSFTAKAEAVIPTKGTGPFIQLSVTATPGKIHSFTAKAEYVAPVIPTPEPETPVIDVGGGGGGLYLRPTRRDYGDQNKQALYQQALREDNELLELIAAFLEIM